MPQHNRFGNVIIVYRGPSDNLAGECAGWQAVAVEADFQARGFGGSLRDAYNG